MTEAVNRQEVMARRFDLVEQIGIIQGRHKLELEPLNEELNLCEKFVHESMVTAGEQQVKFDGIGQCYFTTQDSVTVADMDDVIKTILSFASEPPVIGAFVFQPEEWQEVLDYIFAHGMWGLLNKAVNKTAAKEMIEAKTPVEGVKYEARKVLAWQRGKA